jgi:hypothetical protein
LTAHSVNSTAQPIADSSALTPNPAIDFASPANLDLVHRLAHLLTLWKKSENLSAAKLPSRMTIRQLELHGS